MVDIQVGKQTGIVRFRMNPLDDSLLKYDTPILVKKTDDKSTKGPPLGVNPQQSANSGLSPPSPRLNLILEKSDVQDKREILDAILPPRKWTERNQLWVQHVSSAPCTRADLIKLTELLDTKLEQKQATFTGICSVRRELYAQFFDELIRQVTVNCTERGLLLLRVRDEINLTMAAYQTLYESKVAFDIRTELQSMQEINNMKQQISDLENENEFLRTQLDEQEKKCDVIKKQEAEKRQLDEEKFNEEIRLLKETIEELKAQLASVADQKVQIVTSQK